jgi:protein phosphatase
MVPPASRFEEAIQELIEYNESLGSTVAGCEAEVKGGVVLLKGCENKPLIVIGDIHGDVDTLRRIREMFLDSRGKSSLIIFLGDYVDRGSPEGQVETIVEMHSIASEFKGNVVFMRGNHEPPPGLEPHPHDYPKALMSIYGSSSGLRLYEASRRLFESLFHAVVVKGAVLAVHGGPPTIGFTNDVFEYLAWDRSGEAFIEILWNDPYETDVERLPNPRGLGSLWGRPVTRRALSATGTKAIVRAHEPALYGFKFNHGRKVITIFSRKGAPYGNISAAVAVCERARDLAFHPEVCIKTV